MKLCVEKLPLMFLTAFGRMGAPKMEKCVQYCCLPKNCSLLTRFSVRPNVNYTTASATSNVSLAMSDCRHVNSSQPMKPTVNYITKLVTRSYSKMQSGSRRKSKIDPMARYGGLNPSSLKLGFEKVKGLEDADEQVKKMFTLEYADDSEIQAYRKSKLVEAIQKDPTDKSLPVKVAVTTHHIRAAAKQYAQQKKDLASKALLLGSIGRRRRQLKHLRKTDYERFEKLLVELGITYTIPPPANAFRRQTKRYLEKFTVYHKARAQRLAAMDEYLKEKREAQMREIVELKTELGIDLTEEEVKYIEPKTEDS